MDWPRGLRRLTATGVGTPLDHALRALREDLGAVAAWQEVAAAWSRGAPLPEDLATDAARRAGLEALRQAVADRRLAGLVLELLDLDPAPTRHLFGDWADHPERVGGAGEEAYDRASGLPLRARLRPSGLEVLLVPPARVVIGEVSLEAANPYDFDEPDDDWPEHAVDLEGAWLVADTFLLRNEPPPHTPARARQRAAALGLRLAREAELWRLARSDDTWGLWEGEPSVLCADRFAPFLQAPPEGWEGGALAEAPVVLSFDRRGHPSRWEVPAESDDGDRLFVLLRDLLPGSPGPPYRMARWPWVEVQGRAVVGDPGSRGSEVEPTEALEVELSEESAPEVATPAPLEDLARSPARPGAEHPGATRLLVDPRGRWVLSGSPAGELRGFSLPGLDPLDLVGARGPASASPGGELLAFARGPDAVALATGDAPGAPRLALVGLGSPAVALTWEDAATLWVVEVDGRSHRVTISVDEGVPVGARVRSGPDRPGVPGAALLARGARLVEVDGLVLRDDDLASGRRVGLCPSDPPDPMRSGRPLTAAALSAGGRRLALGFGDSRIFPEEVPGSGPGLWLVGAPGTVPVELAQEVRPDALALSGDGRWLAVGQGDALRLVDLVGCGVEASLDAAEPAAPGMRVVRSSEALRVALRDATARVVRGARFASLAMDHDGDWLVALTTGGRVEAFDLRAEAPAPRVGGLHHLALHPSGAWALAAPARGPAVLHALPGGDPVRTIGDAADEVRAVAFSSDGVRLAVGFASGEVVAQRVEDGEVLHQRDRADGDLRALAFWRHWDEDRWRLFTVGRSLVMWGADAPEFLADQGLAPAFVDHRQAVASEGQQRVLLLGDFDEQPLFTLPRGLRCGGLKVDANNQVTAAALGERGEDLALAMRNPRGVGIWHRAEGKWQAFAPRRGRPEVTSLAVSVELQEVAAGDAAGGVQRFHLQSAEALDVEPVPTHRGEVHALAYQGRTLTSAGADGVLRRRECPPHPAD